MITKYLQKMMDTCKMSGMGTRLERVWLWMLMPLILIDIVIHGNDWDEYYDSDPLWGSIVEYHEFEDYGK